MSKIGAFVVAGMFAAAAVVSVGAAPASAGGGPGWKQVSTGSSHTCGLTTDGRIFCWGFDADGRLGDSDGNDSSPTPLEVEGGATDWKQVDAGNTHTCAVKTDGRMFCWGSDGTGQLGDGTLANPASTFTPVEVAGGATNWKQVDAGVAHTCATKVNGRLFCWGNDSDGQLGDGTVSTPTGNPTPLQVTGSATDWKKVAIGGETTCATKANRRLFCWGSDLQGQVGDGTTGPEDNPVPIQVVGNSTKWKAVTVGELHTCATKVNRRLFCWGLDESGRLGDGTEGFPFPNPAPVQVTGNLKTWTQLDAGQDHTCARKKNRRLFCWGNDGDGALGDGMTVMPTSNPAPVQVTGGAKDWKQFSAGEDHTCATKTDGRLFCWGNDDQGQLGDGTTGTPNENPAPIEVLLV